MDGQRSISVNKNIKMKIIITKKTDINSVKGKFVKLSYIEPETGETDSIFTTKEEYDKWGYDDSKVADANVLKSLATDPNVQLSDVEFNKRGSTVMLS